MHRIIAALSLLVLAQSVHAGYYYRTSKHTYYVDVRNQSFRDIWGAWVTVYETGDHSAQITVRADGYRDAHDYVSINPNQEYVNVRVTLQDPSVQVAVVDRDSNFIPGTWVDQNQFSAGADEYRLEVRMPSEGFTKFQVGDVRIDFVFGASVRLWGPDSARRVEIRVPRRSLGSTMFVSLRVRIPSDAQLQQVAREMARVEKFEKLHAQAN